MSLEEKPRPVDFVAQPEVIAEIQESLEEGRLPCPRAFAIARRCAVEPLTADTLGVRVSRCQLGLFGYVQKQAWRSPDFEPPIISEALQAAIQGAAVDGLLPCARAWEIAASAHVSRLVVGYAANQLSIRIVQCQLGAF